MKKLLNIAVFGLSLNMMDQLKTQILRSLPYEVNVRWVNIAENDIDLLFVNDAFYSSSNIQKILSQLHVHYLRLVKAPEQQGKIIEDTLTYPVTQLDDLREWLQETFFDYETQYRGHLGSQKIDQSISISTVLEQCLSARNGYIRLFNSKGFLALVDTVTQQVWLSAENPIQRFDRSVNYTYATNQFVQDTIKQLESQDLHTWLWHMAYQTDAIELINVPLNQHFRLDIWPKFEASLERRDLLKIASSFAQGAQVKKVIEQLNLPKQQVIRFVALSHMLKMGTWIGADEATFLKNGISTEQGQMLKVRSFFNKLRKKLGL